MYEAKTRPTTASVSSYIAAVDDPERRRECRTLVALMKRATGCPPKMWGTSIVGFDSYHYRYASGHEGDSCVVGFSARKGALSLYLLAGYDDPEAKALLAKLGRHEVGKACLYVKHLDDVDLAVLERLVARSAAEIRRRYPAAGAAAGEPTRRRRSRSATKRTKT
jgi:hypothetical protein